MRLLTRIFALALLLIPLTGSSQLGQAVMTTGNQNIAGTKTFAGTAGLTIATGVTLNMQAGSTLTVSGAFGGTATGGTVDWSALTMTLPTSALQIGTSVQGYSANLDEYAAVNPTAAGLALLDDADNTAQRDTLGLGTMATQAASAVAITGGTLSGITAFAGSTAANEFTLVSAGGAAINQSNVLSLKCTNASYYSAMRFLKANGDEAGAIGFGNSASNAQFANATYIETSDASNGGSAPPLYIVQSTTYAGALAYGINRRMGFEANGTINFFARTGSTPLFRITTGSEIESYAVFRTYSGVTPAVELQATSPLITGGAGIPGASGYLELRGSDANAAIILREGGNNRHSYYIFGDTLANNGGHKFYTGGLKASQTVKFHVANDGTSFLGSGVANSITVTSGTFVFEGATADAHETTLAVTDPTADRTVTIPNLSGTVSLHSAQTVSLTADDQSITVTGSLIEITSDDATAANRTFVLAAGSYAGQRITLMFRSSGNNCELLNTGTAVLTAAWEPGNLDTLDLIYSTTESKWVETARSSKP